MMIDYIFIEIMLFDFEEFLFGLIFF